MDKLKLFYKKALEIYGEELVDLQDSSVLVLYPKVIIENSQSRLSHEIKDLVLRFPISSHIFYSVDASRLSISVDEWRYEYLHSHLPARLMEGDVVRMEHFCTGTSGMDSYMIELSETQDEDSFMEKVDEFLIFVEHFISVESQAGGPFRKIKNLGVIGTGQDTNMADRHTHSITRMVNYLIQHKPSRFVSHSWAGDRFLVSLNEEARLYNTYPHISGLNPHRLEEGGTTRRVLRDAQSTIPDSLDLKDWRFKNKNKCVIYDKHKFKENENEERYYISHLIAEKVEKRLEERLQEELTRELITVERAKWNSIFDNNSRCFKYDKTTLL